MDPLQVIACAMLGMIIGGIVLIVMWQVLKWAIPWLRDIDLL